MIKVDRKIDDIPVSLKGKASLGLKERSKVITYFSNPANCIRKKTKGTGKIKSKKELFEVYRNKDVKSALIKLFQSKCAYCESYIMRVSPGAIEHFRPKTEVHEKIAGVKKDNVIYPGYYWLGSEWKNLLFSCTDCNTKRTHKLLNGTERVMGKGNYFPLSDSTKRMRKATQRLSTEENYRLLINPCEDEPESFFIYDHKDGSILPRVKTGRVYDMADASINVYGLHRIELLDARKKFATEIITQIERVKEATYNLNAAKTLKEEQRLLSILKRETNILKSYKNSDSEYSGLARYLYKTMVK
jgi:uncharacterized protein (TIGR02646 family)